VEGPKKEQIVVPSRVRVGVIESYFHLRDKAERAGGRMVEFGINYTRFPKTRLCG